MIMDKDVILTAMEMLTSDDFYHKQYGILFDAMIEPASSDFHRPHYLGSIGKEKMLEQAPPFPIKNFDAVPTLNIGDITA